MTKRRKALFVAAIGLTVLVAIELGLRSILGLGNPPLLVADDEIGYIFAADQDVHRFGHRVHINRYHQRSDDVSEQPGDGIHRILCVGDSVSWGGVLCQQDRTYPEILRGLLLEAGVRAEVLNASAGSWGVGNHLAYLRRFGTFDSCVVVLQVGSGDLLQPKSTCDCVGCHPSFPDRKPILAIEELVCRYVLPRILKGSVVARPSSREDREIQFEKNMADFRACVAVVRQARAEVLVFHNRNRTEVLDLPIAAGGAFEVFRARFLTICHELDVPVVDLATVWRDDERAGTFFRDGVHLTEDGNAAAARALVPVILKCRSE